MSRVILLEPNAGISGDMLLGALVDAGASIDVMNAGVEKATGGRAKLAAEPADRGGLRCCRVKVLVDGAVLQEAGGPADGAEAARGSDHHHRHEHRKWSDIDQALAAAGLEPAVAEASRVVFRRLALAEAAVHGRPDPESVHFHEVGAMDAVADIVGCAAGLEFLGAATRWHTPPRVGGGSVSADHGRLPVPAPATLELLRDRKVVSGGQDGELVTPTGAALLTLFEPMPDQVEWTPDAVGYGAGSRNPRHFPNLLRLTLGSAGGPTLQIVDVVEASLDDCTPEEIAHWCRALMDEGALDVTVTPLIMKKGRPGFLLRLLGESGSGPHWADRITQHTTTLGARWRMEMRSALSRRMETVEIYGEAVHIKVAGEGDAERVHVEFDDLARLAQLTGRRLADLRREVENLWLKNRPGRPS